MKDVNELVRTVFSGLSSLVIEDVADEGEWIVVRARTPQELWPARVRGVSSGHVHGYHWRMVADVSVDDRRVVVRVRVRCLVCPTRCCCHTFGEQVPRVLDPAPAAYDPSDHANQGRGQGVSGPGRGTVVGDTGVSLSRHTALRTLLWIPLPVGRVPRVIGVDDFALRRRHRYATG